MAFDYIERLFLCGISIDDAWSIVNDFCSDLDFEGLDDFVRERERCCMNGGGMCDVA